MVCIYAIQCYAKPVFIRKSLRVLYDNNICQFTIIIFAVGVQLYHALNRIYILVLKCAFRSVVNISLMKKYQSCFFDALHI